MDQNENHMRSDLIRVNRILAGKGLICSSDSNISVRLDSKSLLITPSGVYKSAMTTADLIVVDLDGKV